MFVKNGIVENVVGHCLFDQSFVDVLLGIGLEFEDNVVISDRKDRKGIPPVSYTHLTLPTICSV